MAVKEDEATRAIADQLPRNARKDIVEPLHAKAHRARIPNKIVRRAIGKGRRNEICSITLFQQLKDSVWRHGIGAQRIVPAMALGRADPDDH